LIVGKWSIFNNVKWDNFDKAGTLQRPIMEILPNGQFTYHEHGDIIISGVWSINAGKFTQTITHSPMPDSVGGSIVATLHCMGANNNSLIVKASDGDIITLYRVN